MSSDTLAGLALKNVQQAIATRRARGESVLSIFTMAGYPDRKATGPVLLALQEAGVDFVELGIPFSDPMADGPIIQAAAQQALEGGFRLQDLFATLAELKTVLHIPVFLMAYFNNLFAIGVEAFLERSAEVGVAGLIVPDWPVEEQEAFRSRAQALGLGLVQLVAPNTPPERIARLDALSQPFLYCVSYTGTTGQFGRTNDSIQRYLQRVHSMAHNPLLVGFGVRRAEDVVRVVPPAAGVIVGSAFLKTLAEEPHSFEKGLIKRFVQSLRPVTDS